MTWRGSDDAIRNLIAREIWRYQECPWDFDAPDSPMGDLQKQIAIDQAECIRKVVMASAVVKAYAASDPVDMIVEAWIKREYGGRGVAIRAETDPPIPGEPFIALAEAAELTRRAVADFVIRARRAALQAAIEAIRAGRDDFACGEDMGKITNSILAVAESRIDGLKRGQP